MTDPIRLRDARPSDLSALEAVIRGVGLFTPDEAAGFAETLPAHFDEARAPGTGPFWLVEEEGGGAAYVAPEPSPGVWNLLFLGVLPSRRRRGVARALVVEVEDRLRRDGARMLLIDTSTTAPMAAARALYPALGYSRVGEIPDYWGQGDGKITFCKPL